jgi:hypothetical protein
MKLPARVLHTFEENPDWPPLHPIVSWGPRPDDGGHTHCLCCGRNLVPGDRCVGRYFEYTCVVSCPACVGENPQWMASAQL